MRRFTSLLCFVSAAALAQAPTFEAANKYLAEQSFSKSCESFEAFLKANAGSPLAREATSKRAYACWKVGKRDGSTELTKLADAGEQDFARAFAQWALAQQGYRQFQQAIPLLQTATKAEGRVGDEARRLLVAGCLTQLDNATWDVKLAEKLTPIVLEYATNEADKAHARFDRAQAWLRTEATRGKGEQELTDVGATNTAWADDALFLLGQQRESKERYVDALTIYDGIVKRFSSTTSNRHSDARYAAENIRSVSLSVSAYQVTLPGLKLPVQVSWRNVKRVTWTLRRADPFSPKGYPDSVSAFSGGPVEKTWSETFEVKSQHAPGNKTFELELPSPGLYTIEAAGDGVTGSDLALMSQVAVITKSDRKQVQVFVTDVETGAAQPNAEVMFVRGNNEAKQLGRTNAQGLATFQTETSNNTHHVWVKRGADVAYSRAGDAYWSSWSRQDLAYVMMDRPLYKPGETVGLKLFLRSREGGPSEPIAERAVIVTVRDPNGKEIAKPTLTTNVFGTAFTTVALPKNATLGAWYVSVTDSSNNRSFQQPQLVFRVEEYKPPEAIVSVSAVGSPKPGDPVKLKVTAKYYSGGPLTGAQGRAIVTVSQWQHQFGKWPDEQDANDTNANSGEYDDEDRYSRGRGRRYGYYGPIASHTLVFKTGVDGTAEIEVPATPDQGTDLQVTAQVFVTDASRREIQGSGSAKLSRSPYFVDVRSDHFLYRPGEKVTLRLRSEDANGRPMSPDVLVRLSRISDPNTGALSKIAEVRTKLVSGLGLAQLDADALGAVRVEVVDVDAKQGQAPLATADLWLTSDTKPIPPPGPGFQLLMDRAPLSVGQTLRALIVTPQPGGHVWLTLEHDLIVTSRVIEMNGRTKYVELPIPAAATPNVWLMASRSESGTILQQQQGLKVRGSEVELDVKVAFDRAVAEPGSSVPVSIRATKGPAGPTETALTIVDEALFAIEPEKQDFSTFFGRQQRNQGVQTRRSTDWRSFRSRPVPQPKASADTKVRPPQADTMMDEVGANKMAAEESAPASRAMAGMAAPSPVVAGNRMMERSEKRKDSAGPRDADDASGSTGADAPVKARTDFGSSAGWYAALVGKIDAPVSQAIKVTDSLTSWKAVATVVTPGPHLGRGSATMRTARPLMVRLQTPRFIIEGDEVVLSAVIESHLAKAGPVDVVITAPGMLALGPTKKTVTVTPEQVVRFDARFKITELGDRLIRAQVKSGSAADAMELTIPALVHGSAQRQFFAGRLSDTFTFDVELPQKRKASLTKLELNLSPSLLAVMLDGLPYLAQYPYGCVEQTLSRFVPAVIARKAAKDLSLPAERLPKDLDDMVQKGLERLAGFQHGDGGWGWWQSDRTNLWMTAYVVYALGLAKDAGLTIDTGMVSRGRTYLLGHLGEALDNPDTHAFAVYALAQSGPVPKAVLDQTFAQRTKMQPRGRSLVALALLAAKDSRARVAVENLDDIVKVAEARKDAAVGEVNDAWSTSAAIEATAYTLMAMSRWADGAKYVGPLTDFLVLRRNGGKWRTTRDTAFAIYALADLARREKAASQQGSFTVTINGRQVKQLKYAKGGLDVPALFFSDADFKAGKNTVQVRRDGAGTGYWAATWDVFNQNDFIKGVGGDVKVARSYTLLGKPSTEKSTAPTEYGMPVESGVRVRVDVEITANKAVEFVMLEDLKPAGFEAVQQRSGPEVCNYACAHAELRTDRVAMFLSELKVGTTKLSYELRAETPGRFSALPARVEAMYAPEIQATADEMRFEVRDTPTTGVAAQ
ncbi:MAG: MG2 domain-containing protein [Myxococcales bacterium]|nr:MG2 domain-containing protein [Myxococcales bacterium]